jgi:UDP-N-acetyl-D-glucosamine dehydrogenase
MKSDLINRLKSKQAVIGIVGLGYVGLPLTLRYCEVGYKVVGFDIDQGKINSLKRGQSYIEHIAGAEIKKAVAGCFDPTSDFSRAREVDALVLCVPTPLNRYREPDLSFVLGTTEALVPHLHEKMVVSLESTTYPGTTDEELKPRIEASGLTVGKDIFLVFSPEREDPGNPNFSTQTIPKVCGGHTTDCLEVGLALTVVSSTRSFPSVRRAPPSSLSCLRTSIGRST